jgi:two-component system cell cycle response regulator
MVQHLASRPMSILIVSSSSAESMILRYGLQDALETDCKFADAAHDLAQAAALFEQHHHDIVIVHGFSSTYSQAFVIKIRKSDGRRHTGIIVMAPTDDGFDGLVVDNHNAGADEVVPQNLSLAILRSKMIMVFNYKVTTDLLRAANHKLKAMAITDELTGCSNMRGFTVKFAQSMTACSRGQFGVAIMMMDLDHFKKINDNHNHLVGSHVIKSTGQFLMKCGVLSKQDLVARYGGDEFVLLVHGPDPLALSHKAQKIGQMLAEQTFIYDSVPVKITASIGLAWAAPGFSGQSSDLVKGADAMLYRSKEEGRNKVNAMILRYPIDFSKIGANHIINLSPISFNEQVKPTAS